MANLKGPELNIRTLEPEDIHFLKSMFYESLFVPPGADTYPRTIIEEPHLAKYYLNWGRVGDNGHIVEVSDQLVGAIWSRYFTEDSAGYGYISDDMPELGIALAAPWRGKGLGSNLIAHHLHLLKDNMVRGVSLSVDARNDAMRLYERFGFIENSRSDQSVTMFRKL